MCECRSCREARVWFREELSQAERTRLGCLSTSEVTPGTLMRENKLLKQKLREKTLEANNLRLRVEELMEVPMGTFGGKTPKGVGED